MKKNIVGGLGVLVAVSIVLYFIFFNHAEAPATDALGDTPESPRPGTVVAQGVSTFATLYSTTDVSKCMFSTDAIGGDSLPTNGVVYTAGGRVRVDTTIIENNEEMSFSSIDDGTYTYSWGKNSTGSFAIKSKRIDAGADTELPVTEETPAFDFNQEVEYDCEVWNLDESVFLPPSDVSFIDMTDLQAGSGLTPEQMTEMLEQFPN
jgi:hypothetical protein